MFLFVGDTLSKSKISSRSLTNFSRSQVWHPQYNFFQFPQKCDFSLSWGWLGLFYSNNYIIICNIYIYIYLNMYIYIYEIGICFVFLRICSMARIYRSGTTKQWNHSFPTKCGGCNCFPLNRRGGTYGR